MTTRVTRDSGLTSDNQGHSIRELLGQHRELRSLSPAHLDALAFAFVETVYQDGSELISQGAREPTVVLILKGQAECTDRSGARTSKGPGELVSTLACIYGGATELRCSARGELLVARLGGAAARMLMGTGSEMGKALFRACESGEPERPTLELRAVA